jgi:hypothetical protein
MDIQTLFPNRANADGSFDSICPTCYATVARSKTRIELAELDAAHRCNKVFLAERSAFALAECARRRAAM